MMFRKMRRNKQQLSEAEAIEILQSCTSGVLAVSGDDDYPYAVPLNYAYRDGKLYFHLARAGHKLEAIQKHDKVSFCVIKTDEVVPETFSTNYRSAIVFGRARILTDDAEKKYGLECLVEKYSPDYVEKGQSEIKREWNRVCVVEVTIEHMTGKAAMEIINNKEPAQ
jgi:nitroimidazol reductase NimA-like FMN-containing flavoprotein (pyridoxamine 5'-phosphate oxidase superfamily)